MKSPIKLRLGKYTYTQLDELFFRIFTYGVALAALVFVCALVGAMVVLLIQVISGGGC